VSPPSEYPNMNLRSRKIKPPGAVPRRLPYNVIRYTIDW